VLDGDSAREVGIMDQDFVDGARRRASQCPELPVLSLPAAQAPSFSPEPLSKNGTEMTGAQTRFCAFSFETTVRGAESQSAGLAVPVDIAMERLG
jgi:hypothetical protein